MDKSPNIIDVAVIGAGLGGMAAAGALQHAGINVHVFEQAPAFGRVGVAINTTPNAVTALDGLGLGQEIRAAGHAPVWRINRMWDSGEELSRMPMAAASVEKYGTPQLLLHRADLVEILAHAVDPQSISFDHRLIAINERDDFVELRFSNGTIVNARTVVGADGVHSVVRNAVLIEDAPRFTNVVAYRASVPADKLSIPDMDSFTKWWGPVPEHEIVTFRMGSGNDFFLFGSVAAESTAEESWSAEGTRDELRRAFVGFHEDVQPAIEASEVILKTAIYERAPLQRWSTSRVTLLGDSAHAMLPFMAQGAAMALEDGIVLSRAIAAFPQGDRSHALQSYEQTRKGRTSRLQSVSRINVHESTQALLDDVYSYDPWKVELGAEIGV